MTDPKPATDDTEVPSTGEELNVADLNLSDSELIRVLKNHGTSRRSVMKAFGVGTAVSALGGTAAGQPGRGNNGRGTRIDEVYGAPYAAGDNVPSGLVDHLVELHIHPGDATHEGFPVPDGPDGDNQDDLPETFFDPVGLHVSPGEIVQFTTHGDGLHTVTAFDPKFNEPPFLLLPDRVPTEYGFTSPPVTEGDSWLYKFTTKGVYDLFCLPHVSLGMVMRIVVFDPKEDSLDDPTFNEPPADPQAPLPPAAKTVLTDGALDPVNIVGKGEVPWADLSLGSGSV